MKAEQGCAGCIIDDISGAVKLMGVDEKKQLEVIKSCMDYMGKNFDFNTLPSVFITEVHRIAKHMTGQRLPFAELRKNCNDVGLALSKKLAAKQKSKKDSLKKFEELIKWVIASNHLDFRTVGTGYHVPIKIIEKHVRDKVAEPLKVNHVAQFYKFVNDVPKKANSKTQKSEMHSKGAAKKSEKGSQSGALNAKNASNEIGKFHTHNDKPRVLFIHDNVGEIAFDRLLIQDLKERGWFVISALRGGPITSDATLEDGAYVGMEKYADMIICAGPDTLGISWEEKSPELDEALHNSDLIISKGQANFYLFSDYQKELKKPVMCLLTTKCPYVSSYFKKTELISVAHFFPS